MPFEWDEKFEWDEEKAQINLTKHHIDFKDAAAVFDDPHRVEWYDAAHSTTEDRYNTIGMSCLSFTQNAESESASYLPAGLPQKKGESTMIVTYDRKHGTPLTPEQIKRLDDLKNHSVTFDEDCPEMTDEQLKQFRRVNPPQNRATQ